MTERALLLASADRAFTMFNGLLLAQIVLAPVAAPLPPAEAAAVLARLDSPANVRFVCTDCDGPRSVVIRSDPGAGPFGPFAPFPALRPLNCCSFYAIHAPRRYGRPVTIAPAFGVARMRGHRGAAPWATEALRR